MAMNTLSLENIGRSVESGGGIANETLRSTRETRSLPDLSEAQNGSSAAPGASFSDILRDSVSKVNEYQHQADHAIKELVAGRDKNIHETMLAIERADLALKLMVQVRNKVLDAYREIMRMQV